MRAQATSTTTLPLSFALLSRCGLTTHLACSAPLGLPGTLWTSYGALVIHDPFVWGPNGFGFGMSMVQLGLIARFGTGPPAAAAAAEAVVGDSAKPTAEAEGTEGKAEGEAGAPPK